MRVFRNFIKICLILLTVALGGPVWADATDYNMTCDEFAAHVQEKCPVGWDSKGEGYRPDCQTCKVAWMNEGNDCSYLPKMRGYCYDSNLNSIQCPENTYADNGANGLCINCPPEFPFHDPFQYDYNPGEKGIDYCYTRCSPGLSGNDYYNATDTCTPTGGGSGGGGEDPQKNQIVSGTCSGDTDDAPPEDLESYIATLTDNCDDWDSKGEFNLKNTLDQMKEQCGLGDKDNDEYYRFWVSTEYAKVTVCPSMNVGACLLTPNVPMSWECVTKDCPSGWTGKKYGNNCSKCSMNCSPNGLGEGIELATEGTIYYGAYCSNEPEKTCGYKCAKGFYGTATSASAGCTKCPEHATCDGGNKSTFVCDDKYYKAEANATKCTFCPDNAVCEEGKPWVCKQGFYKDGEKCTGCPEAYGVKGTTSANGATDVSKCYAPANNSTWKVGEDSTGYWEYRCVQNASYEKECFLNCGKRPSE